MALFPKKTLSGGPTTAVQRCLAAAAVVLVLALTADSPASAQQLTTQQIEQMRQNPELVRQRIRDSGLTPDQIRSRLQAAGYSASLLDPFLSTEGAATPTVDTGTLRALELLGVADVLPQGLEPIPFEADTQPGAAPSPAPEGLQLFGLDVFRGRTTQFQPLLTGPVPPNYRVGPGDVMVLVITGDVELIHELDVTREGFVVIPQVGQLYVNGLTMESLNALFRERLGRSYSGVRTGTTRFDVTIARLRTNQVFVIGEVTQPGAYQLASVATVLNALYAAGGPTERAGFRKIAVRRMGETVATFDLYDYLLSGDTRNDVVLEQGDVVFVPTYGTRASVTGAVVRPAIYELTDQQTLADLIDAAGGFVADAALRRISISRIVPPGQRRADGPQRVVVDVPIQQLEDGRPPPFPIEPGDSITVFSLSAAERGLVTLLGAVYHPGTYGWSEGMRLSELIDLAGGFRPAVYTGRAHIERLNARDSTRYMVTVELPADSTQPYPNDLMLDDYDIVTVYGREEFREERTVTIGGIVNEPGAYPHRAGMTLRDLVMMARGLRDGALLDSVEVARLPADRRGGTLAVRLSASMDSTFLLEPDQSTYRLLPGIPGPARGATDFVLEPFDRVTVFRQPEFELLRTVVVTGEVAFPGPLALLRKDERVSDLVDRAGGLLPTAYADGARFYRAFGDAGQVNLNLSEALAKRGRRFDIILQPGDSLHVPEYLPTVRVNGAVHAPTSVLYREGVGLDYYLDNAGGLTHLADEGRISVRYANGSAAVKQKFLFFGSSPTPGPGSTVIVPEKDPDAGVDFVALFGNVAQVLAAAVTVIVVATR